jgi:phosphatidylserine decarboxylase
MPGDHFEAIVKVLEHTTDHATSNHGTDPKETLHQPAGHTTSHSLLRKFLPEEYVEHFESTWHMGNYVIDRVTGEKHWEDMSIYVRLGSY